MSNQWKCIHCGQNNPKAMRFCPNCGKPNAAENAPTVAAKSSYAPAVAKAKSAASPRNNRKLLIGAAIALWVTGLLVLAGGGFMWWNRSQEEAAQITAATVKAAIAQTQIAQAVTNTPAPTSTPPPEDTVVATEMPTETPVEKSAAFAPTKESVATENSVSSGDVLSLPTATPTLTPSPSPTPQPTLTSTPKPVYVAPAPTVAPNCPAPGAQISSPYAGARFTRRNNFIIGTANIPRLHHWKIEYSTDPNGGWQYLLERDYPVENDKLVMIDASTIPRGPYGLRLTVVEDTGNYPEPCEVWFINAY